MRTMLREAAVLLAITVVSGLILGVAYEITRTPIAEAEEAAARAAYQEVFPEAADFEALAAVPMEGDDSWQEKGYGGVTVEEVFRALDKGGQLLGYVLTVTSHEGYGGDITFSMGIQCDGTLNGISLLDISETAGLGMKAEEVLKPQFAGKNAAEFVYTKTGAAAENQIDAISGATITTNAVTTAVNGGLYYFQTQLGGGLNES